MPEQAVSVAACARCGTELAPALLDCPACRALVHATELRRLADEAAAARATGDAAGAAERWRRALELLPAGSQQHDVVSRRLAEFAKERDAEPRAPGDGGRPAHRRLWALAIAGLVFVLTKAKLLLLGLTKLGTMSSMLVFLGVYWQVLGWWYALGLVVSIYIHEMGHVAALLRYGIQASAPMFVPGLGAFVRLKQAPASVYEDARVGLAGPIWGLGSALAAYAVYLVTSVPLWGAIAHTAGLINLFNLLPVWQLDGGRGFRALSRSQRWVATGAIGAVWALTGQGLLALLGIASGAQAFATAPDEGDRSVLATYVLLVLALAALSMLRIPTGAVP